MLRRSRGGVREEKGEFGVYMCAEGFEGFNRIKRWHERDLLVGGEVVEHCFTICFAGVLEFREVLSGEAEARRETAGQVGVEYPSVEFAYCVGGYGVAGYSVALLGRDEVSPELDFGVVGFVHRDKVGNGARLESWQINQT